MELFAPKYYNNFKCIADKCKHSCCIGWRIGIDEQTLAKYRALPEELAAPITGKLAEDEEGTHIILAEGERCPHLTECGLCRIISTLGEEYTSEICREHPRFYNTLSSRAEVGIGASCEEAARIIASSDEYSEFVKVGEITVDGESGGYSALCEREAVYALLSDREVQYSERLRTIALRYGAPFLSAIDDELRAALDELEYLDESHHAVFTNYSSAEKNGEKYERELERFLAYLIFRHASSAYDLCDFHVRIAFSLFLERLAASVADSCDVGICEAIRIISEEIEYSEDNTDALIFEFESMET